MLAPGLEGHTALVTGAASGIGQSIAVGLARQGVKVFIADRQPGEATIEMTRAAGSVAQALQVDLRQPDEVVAMTEAAIAKTGGVDIFVNVAGLYLAGTATGWSLSDWDEQFAVNVRACALIGRHIVAHMIGRGRGSILVVGSTVVCAPSYEGSAYGASKMALRSYMETLAIEGAPFGIRVNMLTPGPFPTALMGDLPAEQRTASSREVPLGQREGDLAEVQAAAVFLVSDRLASYITGAELHVDGGWHLRPLYLGPLDVVKELNAGAGQHG